MSTSTGDLRGKRKGKREDLGQPARGASALAAHVHDLLSVTRPIQLKLFQAQSPHRCGQ